MPQKILLATLGSLGDLHPFLALGRAAQAVGHAPVVAAAGMYRRAIEDAGLAFHEIRPDQDEFLQSIGMSLEEMAHRVLSDDTFVIRVVLRFLRRSTADLLAAAEGSAVIVTHPFALAGKLAAEKLQIPHVDLALSPSLFLSAYDPPLSLPLPFLRKPTASGLLWNRMLLGLMKRLMSAMMRSVPKVRSEMGLPPIRGIPVFEDPAAAAFIALFSPLLGQVQPDYPENTSVVGFSFYDGPAQPVLDQQIDDFLAAGSPPIVVTVGSFAALGGMDFFRVSVRAIRSLGRRVIVLIGHDEAETPAVAPGSDILLRRYVPHSLLFPRAAAIIHHGGIGTTAQALRAGKPQLVIPFFADQPDNAARIFRLGVGRALRRKRCSFETVRAELTSLLDTPSFAERAAEISQVVAVEDGPATAIPIIERVMARGARYPAQM